MNIAGVSHAYQNGHKLLPLKSKRSKPSFFIAALSVFGVIRPYCVELPYNLTETKQKHTNESTHNRTSKRWHEQTNEGTNAQTNEGTNAQTNEGTNAQTNAQRNEHPLAVI